MIFISKTRVQFVEAVKGSFRYGSVGPVIHPQSAVDLGRSRMVERVV